LRGVTRLEETRLVDVIPAESLIGHLPDVGRDRFAIGVDVYEPGEPWAVGQPLTITGWAVDRETRASPERALLCVDGWIYRLGYVGLARDSPARADVKDASSRLGFCFTLPTSKLSTGEHRVELILITSIGDALARFDLQAFALIEVQRS
jgi:hypothetical protein